MEVEQAYYQALVADAVLQVAQAALENRRLTLRQVQGLAEGSLKSTLDVSFAEVVVSEAELPTVRSRRERRAGRPRATGGGARYGGHRSFRADRRIDAADSRIGSGRRGRAGSSGPAGLGRSPFNRDAAHRFAEAEED